MRNTGLITNLGILKSVVCEYGESIFNILLHLNQIFKVYQTGIMRWK